MYNYHKQNDTRNINTKGASGEFSDGNEEHVFSTL